MENLREILESKTREELAYLIGLASYQYFKERGDKSFYINVIAEFWLKGDKYVPAKTRQQMIKEIIGNVTAGNLGLEQI